MISHREEYKRFLGDFDSMKPVLGSTLHVKLESETGFSYTIDKYQISVDFQGNNHCDIRVERDSNTLEKKVDLPEGKVGIDWAKVFQKSIGVALELDRLYPPTN